MSDFPRIPGYKIERKLGEGGMATVYLGTQEKLNRKVAIKILDSSYLKNDIVKTRFLKEAETAARLHHTNIIAIIDIGYVGDLHYIVMEFLLETLKERLFGYHEFRMKPEAAIEILKPIIRALDYAHSQGIIHRDIKTENIMFRTDGTPVLVDFGIARALESDNRMTKTGISLGTPYYMSPEQCMAGVVDGRSDIYSLGVVFFEIITGYRPYEADNTMAIALKHIQEPVPKLPIEFSLYQVLIDKMMAKEKENRVANGSELIKLMDVVISTVKDQKDQGEVTRESLAVEAQIESVMDNPKIQHQFIEKTQPVTTIKKQPPVSAFTTAMGSSRTKKKESRVKKIGEIAALAILTLVAFIVFFKLGSQGNNSTDTDVKSNPITQPVTKPVQPKPLQPGPGYEIGYANALDYYNNGDLEKASEAVQQLKTLNPSSPAKKLLDLEEKINLALKERDESIFNSSMNDAQTYFAQKNYESALESLEEAKKIKSTPLLEDLEKRINSIYKKRPGDLKVKTDEKKPGSRSEDDQAFDAAVKTNTIEAYRGYIDSYSDGRHVTDAVSRMDKLKEALQAKDIEKKPAIQGKKFRDRFVTLSLTQVESMIKRFDFFDENFNKTGGFRTRYGKSFPNGDIVLTDDSSRLMFYAGPVAPPMVFSKAEAWIKALNKSKYAGYSDWRLPTIEEAASLLRKKNIEGIYIYVEFPNGLNSIWTGDMSRSQTYWTVQFDDGIVIADSDRMPQQVLPVRSTGD